MTALTEPEARRLTQRIGLTLTTIADNRDRVLDLIRQAKNGGAHLALDYVSWTAYVSAEFGDVLPRLTKDERRPLVAELAAMGMSTRAIAPVVGVSKDTVSREIRAGVSDETPASNPEPLSSPVGGSDVAGAGEPREQPESDDPAPATTHRVAAGPQPETESGAESGFDPRPVSGTTRHVTGRDGKTYPVRPRREPDQATVDELTQEFPELVHYTDRPGDVIRIGTALRGYDEPEKSVRREALGKTIAAERRAAEEPPVDLGPNYAAMADRIFRACNDASRMVSLSGGADAVEQALPRLSRLEVDTYRDQFESLATLCSTLAAVCRPGLRRVQ